MQRKDVPSPKSPKCSGVLKVGRLRDVYDTHGKNYPMNTCFKEIRRGQHTIGSDFIKDSSGDTKMNLKAATLRARELREKGNEAAYTVIKQDLPAYVFAGTLNGNRQVDLFSGLVVLDFDELTLDNIDSSLASLRSHSNVYACWKTLSGERCIALVKVDPVPTEDTFKHAWFAAYQKFRFIGEADPGFRRSGQTATGAWDPDLYVNEMCDHLQWEVDTDGYDNAFPRQEAEDALLSDLPDVYRDALANMEWKENNWGATQLPCIFQEHEHDGWGSRQNGMGVFRHKDGKGWTFNCFKCSEGGKRAYREKVTETAIRLQRFVDYVDSDGKEKQYLEPVPRHIVSEQVTQKLCDSEYTPLRRGAEIGYIEAGIFQPMSSRGMQGILSRTCDLRRYDRGHWKRIHNPPAWLADDVVITQRNVFEELKSICSHPFFDGEKIVYTAGIHDGVFLLNDFDPPIEPPDDPVDMLKELVTDYPLADESDLENTIALILTPFIRQAVDFAPMFFITAPRANLGKSSLADIACFISLGKRPEVRSLPRSKTEIEKSVNAALRYAPEILLFDNIEQGRTLDSGELASIATQPRRAFRRLGVSEENTYENRSTFIYTGSGLSASQELVTRAVEIALEDDGQRAEEKDWALPNIVEEYLPEKYPAYQNAALFMIHTWIREGMPKSEHIHRAGLWAKIVGGILQTNGIGQSFLANHLKMRKRAGADDISENNAWRIAGATLGIDRCEFTAAQIFRIFSYTDTGNSKITSGHNLLGHLWMDMPHTNEHGRRIRLGKYLDSIDGRVFECGFKFIKTEKTNRTGKRLYALQWLGTPEDLVELERNHSLQNPETVEILDPDADVRF